MKYINLDKFNNIKSLIKSREETAFKDIFKDVKIDSPVLDLIKKFSSTQYDKNKKLTKDQIAKVETIYKTLLNYKQRYPQLFKIDSDCIYRYDTYPSKLYEATINFKKMYDSIEKEDDVIVLGLAKGLNDSCKITSWTTKPQSPYMDARFNKDKILLRSSNLDNVILNSDMIFKDDSCERNEVIKYSDKKAEPFEIIWDKKVDICTPFKCLLVSEANELMLKHDIDWVMDVNEDFNKSINKLKTRLKRIYNKDGKDVPKNRK